MTGLRSGGEPPTPGSATAAMRNPRVVAAIVVVLALITGLVLGVFAAPRLMGRGENGHRPYGFGGRGSWGRGAPTDRMRQRFASELGLSTAQVAQVDSILTRSMAERRALDDSVRPRMRALVDSTRARIERILTPEQRQKFDSLHARARSARGGDGGGEADQGKGPPP
jgi:Spy/CpxP family protein refolding chaperone